MNDPIPPKAGLRKCLSDVLKHWTETGTSMRGYLWSTYYPQFTEDIIMFVLLLHSEDPSSPIQGPAKEYIDREGGKRGKVRKVTEILGTRSTQITAAKTQGAPAERARST